MAMICAFVVSVRPKTVWPLTTHFGLDFTGISPGPPLVCEETSTGRDRFNRISERMMAPFFRPTAIEAFPARRLGRPMTVVMVSHIGPASPMTVNLGGLAINWILV